ncbi:MAG: phage terminase large subunit [Aeromonadaceae bacterium]
MTDCPNRRKLELMREWKIRQARKSFWEFRTYMNPKMKRGWWQKEIADELMVFFDDFVAGKRPKLVIQAPPQHGKSVQIVEFLAWLLGRIGDTRCIYTSFSERLGIRANLSIQRMMGSAKYKEVFPNTRIPEKNSVTISGQKLRNREIVELLNGDGYFRNTTVRGSITGESLDLGIIDDPIRGRADANSDAVRNAAWDWFTDDFFTRFSEEAGLLAILTRWHVDDPIGRLIKADSTVKVLSYPAIATHDDANRKAGEALFPEHKSLEFLMERKKVMPAANFEALYQQNPVVSGGEMFKDDWWGEYNDLLTPPEFAYRMIFADTAMKAGQENDFSVFQLWGYFGGGESRGNVWPEGIYLLDQIRGKWEAPELLRVAKKFHDKHVDPNNIGYLRGMRIEDKASGTGLIQTLPSLGVSVTGIPRSKDKVSRANDVLHHVESGRVHLPKNKPWLAEYRAEFIQFPMGVHDDQVDPTIDAINEMLGGAASWLSEW